MIELANHATTNRTTPSVRGGQWITECSDGDASPFLKLAIALIVVFCLGSRFVGQTSGASMAAVAALGLLYSAGVVALTIRTYRQS
jgi:hypothetical protein